MEKDNKQKISIAQLLDKRAKQVLGISIVLIVFSFVAPIIFIQDSIFGLNFMKTGPIGDTIGGIMNPFIALAGIFLTFLAFYIQVIANKQQQDSFRTELNEQKEQFKKSQFENQFYEMLRLHKENVNEFSLNSNVTSAKTKSSVEVSEFTHGRSVFDNYIIEFELCYEAAKQSFKDQDVNVLINEAYGAFFHGLSTELISKHSYFKLLYSISHGHKTSGYSNLKQVIKNKLGLEWKKRELYYPIFKGYSSQLAHYYRHLFQTVKFVANQKDEFLSYEDKRKYLRILRAQLSNQEQVMLFYNWLSRFGKQWENDRNKFFTDFRMIHNIYQDLLIPDAKLDELFILNGNYAKEKDRPDDSLFEFQDW
jgi:hypothetical protein